MPRGIPRPKPQPPADISPAAVLLEPSPSQSQAGARRAAAAAKAAAAPGRPLPAPAAIPSPDAPIDSLSAPDAARLLIRIRDAESSFLGFIRLHHPDWDIPDYQLDLIDKLDKLERRTLLHPATGKPVYCLIVNMPPRHNKSTIATKLFAAYCMARRPSTKTLVSGNSSDLVESFGYDTRNYVTHHLSALAFPDFAIDPSTRAKAEWATLQGGRYLAIGQSGSTAGRPANLLILDDPYPNRQSAESPTQRNAIHSHWESSLWMRREPDNDGRPPITVVIHTRWHPDDVTGRILDSEDFREGHWLHVIYKAITVLDSQVEISRAMLLPSDPRYVPTHLFRNLVEGERYIYDSAEVALWPARFPLSDLIRTRRANLREFEAQYQQSPYVQGGQLIKTSWWRSYPVADELPRFTTIIIGVDAAFKKTDTADYSVAVVAGMTQAGDIYLLEVLRQKFDFPELKRALIQLNTRYRGRGLRALYIEDKASGQSVIQELRSQSGMALIPYKVVHDKVARVHAITPLIEGGRVLVPSSAPWLEDLLKETEQFPNGAHDDQVDALTIVLDVLARTPIHDVNAMHTPFNPDDSLLAQVRAAAGSAGSAGFAAGSAHSLASDLTPVQMRPQSDWEHITRRALGE